MHWLASFAEVDANAVWRALSGLMLAMLAAAFARSLAPGRVPMIQRIALIGDPELPADLRRYTRRLTIVWCLHFAACALLSLATILHSPATGSVLDWTGAIVAAGTVALFVGEHRLRPRLFPGRAFPGLLQQMRDTRRALRP